MGKPKIALYWCASCGGCEESVVDLAEDLLVVAEKVDIVFWPVAMDFKYEDVEKLSDQELTASFINGAIRNSEQEHIAHLLRQKSKIVVAYGSCAHLGGVPSVANFFSKKEILNRIYKEVPTVNNPSSVFPLPHFKDKDKELTLPEFYENVKPLDQVIKVDYYIPGCPPPPHLTKEAIFAMLEYKLPPPPAVLASQKSLCESCPRRDTKPEKIKLKEFKRVHQIEIDPHKCFLEQGIICLGPVTRGGCGERCIRANMPCRGCFGPLDNVIDMGAKVISFLAALIDSNEEEEIKKVIQSLPDIGGLAYRYGLGSSLLKGKK